MRWLIPGLRRFVLGPTDAEIDAEAARFGLRYPLPHLSVDVPTELERGEIVTQPMKPEFDMANPAIRMRVTAESTSGALMIVDAVNQMKADITDLTGKRDQVRELVAEGLQWDSPTEWLRALREIRKVVGEVGE